jgi:hypothetical protein
MKIKPEEELLLEVCLDFLLSCLANLDNVAWGISMTSKINKSKKHNHTMWKASYIQSMASQIKYTIVSWCMKMNIFFFSVKDMLLDILFMVYDTYYHWNGRKG